jgi:hypothetical protein
MQKNTCMKRNSLGFRNINYFDDFLESYFPLIKYSSFYVLVSGWDVLNL